MDKKSATSFYSSGDFWLVKSASVHIQARFEATKYTEGLSATNRIAVGGPFLQGHRIELGTHDSGVSTVDGDPVLGAFPSGFTSDIFNLRYDDDAMEPPDMLPKKNKKRVVHMSLPLGVSVTVYRWENYLDVRIRMPPRPGQDGVCGNGNGDAGDDSTRRIMARLGSSRVDVGDELLSGRPEIDYTPQMAKMMEAECAVSLQARGQDLCRRQLGRAAPVNETRSCMFDYCFGVNVHARSDAKGYS